MRKARLDALPANTHEGAKALLQERYFNMRGPDQGIPMFGFVGRITSQKGVHLMLESVEELVRMYQGRVQFIIGGMASMADPYGRSCAMKMTVRGVRAVARCPRNPSHPVPRFFIGRRTTGAQGALPDAVLGRPHVLLHRR